MPSKTFNRIGLSLFLFAVLSSLLQLLCGYFIGLLNSLGYALADYSWFKWLLTFLPIYAVGFPVCLLVLRNLPASQKSGIKLGGKNFFIMLCIGICFMYAGNLIGTGLSLLLSGGKAQNVAMNLALDSSPIKIVVIVILAPLMEEYLFRKQIIDRCEKYGEKTAILFSALTFALFHMNFFQFFYAFGLGLVFAYVYTKTHRLRYSVILHMIINFMGSVLAPWILSLIDLEALSDPAVVMNMNEAALAEILPGLAAYGSYVILLLGLAITGLVFFIIRVRKLVFMPATEELPKGQRFKTVYCNLWVVLFTVFCLAFCVYALLA